MRRLAIALVPLFLLSCDREPMGLDEAGSRGETNLAVVSRNDSAFSRGGYASWQDGGLSHWVFVSEVLSPGTGMHVWLSYGAYDAATYESAFYGSGYISPKDVTGSAQGTLQLRTNTDPSVYPTFSRVNHAGGPIEVSWQTVPQTVWRDHWVGSSEWEDLVFRYNGVMAGREALVEGEIIGSTIPIGADAWLTREASHWIVLQHGN